MPFNKPILRQSKQDYGRFAGMAQREKSSKIGIGRYHNPIIGFGASENCIISRGFQSEVPNVHSIVTRIPQPLAENRRQSVVHEKFHGTVSGNSRSRTASAA